MATRFEVIYLGTLASQIDPTEGNEELENSADVVGETFGSKSNPLHAQIKEFSPSKGGFSDGLQETYDNNNEQGNDSFRIDGGSDQVHDATSFYTGIITYSNGKIGKAIVEVFQDTNGNLYLAPSETEDQTHSILSSEPIMSITLVEKQDHFDGLAADRVADGFAGAPFDGTVHGTDGDDIIETNYMDSQGDAVDGADGDDDVIVAGGGNDTIYAGEGDDTIYGGTGDDWVITGADYGDDSIYGGEEHETVDGSAIPSDFVQLKSVIISDQLNNAEAVEYGFANGSLDYMTSNVFAELSDIEDHPEIPPEPEVLGALAIGNEIYVNGVAYTVTAETGGYGEATFDNGNGPEVTEEVSITIFTLSNGTETLYAQFISQGYGNIPTGAEVLSFVFTDGFDDGAALGIGYNEAGTESHTAENVEEAVYNAGNDTLDASDEAADQTLNFDTDEEGTLSNGADNATFSGFENFALGGGDDLADASATTHGTSIHGGDGDDTIIGGTGDDTLEGGAGDDTIVLGDDYGNDTVDGGTSFDGGNPPAEFTQLSNVIITSQFNPTTDTEYSFANGELEYMTSNVYAELTPTGDVFSEYFANNPDVQGVLQIGNEVYINGVAYVVTAETGDFADIIYDAGNGPEVVPGNISVLTLTNGADTIYAHFLAPRSNEDIPAGAEILGYEFTNGLGDGSDLLIGYNDLGLDDFTAADVNIYEEAPEAGYDILDASGDDDDQSLTFTDEETGTISNDTDTTDFDNFDEFVLGAGDDVADASATTTGTSISAGAGDDTLIGGTGDDTFDGGAGNDTFVLGDDYGNDVIDGGEELETVDGSTIPSDYVQLSSIIISDQLNNVNETEYSFANGTLDFMTSNVYAELNPNSPSTLVPDEPNVLGILEVGNEVYVNGVAYTITAETGGWVDIDFDDGSGVQTVDGNVSVFTLSNGSETIYAQVISHFSDEIPPGAEILGFTYNDYLFTDEVLGIGYNEAGTEDFTAATVNETVNGGAQDTLDASDEDADQTLDFTGNESGTLINGSDTVTFTDIEVFELGDGDDVADASNTNSGVSISTGAGEDSITGGLGHDTIDGGDDDDTINSGAGNDTIYGGQGDDSLNGGLGTDTLYGGDGDDTMSGGIGADTLYGGAGDDQLNINQADTAYGGGGDDYFEIGQSTADGAVNTITVVGGEGDETEGDTLDFNGQLTFADIVFTNTDPGVGGGMSGVGTLFDGTTVNFTEIENLIICFTQGTRIATPLGAREVQDLQPGDLVLTRDHGMQPIRWVGTRTVPALGGLAPIRFAPHCVGNDRELLVSPQHRMLINSSDAALLFGEYEVLAAAKHLVNGGSITQHHGGEVTYVHILFDQHEIIYAEGAPSESFFPGDTGLAAVDDGPREELFTLFPELRSNLGTYGDTARLCLKGNEASLLRLS